MKPRGEYLQRLGANALRADTFIAALAHYDDRREFELFLGSVYASFAGQTLTRAQTRSIERTTRKIYEKRLPASIVANHVSSGLMMSLISRGSAIRVHVADDLSVNRSIAALLPRFPKYRSPANFRRHVWKPSKPVLHLGIAFKFVIERISRLVFHLNDQLQVPPHDISMILALDLGTVLAMLQHREAQIPISLIRLIAFPAWATKAFGSAQFHAELMRKAIGDIGELLQIDSGERNAMADFTATSLPSVIYRQPKAGNAEWGSLPDHGTDADFYTNS